MSSAKKSLTRRDFVKGAAVTVAAVAGGSILAGCGGQEATEAAVTEVPTATEAATAVATTAPVATEAPAATEVAQAAVTGRVAGYSGEGDWLGTAPVVADADITNTIDADIVVIGGGHAGVLATIGAIDSGVTNIAVLEKQDEAGFATDYWHRLGEDIGHVNSQWLIDRGYGPYDTGEITTEFCKRAHGRVNPDIIRLFVENSGAMFDRELEIYNSYEELRKTNDSAVEWNIDADGNTATFDFSNIASDDYLINQTQKDATYPIELGGYKTWPTNAQFMGPVYETPVMPFVSVLRYFEKYLVQYGVDNGATWYYEHTGLVLTQDETGAVTGIIAQDKDGNYVKFNAAKGVVVTTGDYIGNPDMAWALLNESMEWAERGGSTKADFVSEAIRNGQGHKMCCWAGGQIEPSPRGSMVLGGGAGGPWGSGPMLQLNANGERYANEAAAPLMGQATLRQPVGAICCVTDAKFMQSVVIAGLEHGGPNYGRPMYYETMEADMANVLGTGADGYAVLGATVAERQTTTVYGANTLEELAGYLGYTGDAVQTFLDSIARYNELCAAGVDSDYGKDAKAMISIDTAPFYGTKGSNSGTQKPAMVTMSGIITDKKLRVLDKTGAAIKGLYVAGNTLGGRYGPGYSTPFAGNSIGMAMTHGWMAGKFAATL